jgi:DNA helicase-2/ATP-dependent DNA helicase PcrA
MDDEPAEELDTARLAGADAVTLLTVHRAKGLEWPIVFIPAAYQSNFPSGVMGSYDNPLQRPESLPYENRLDREDLPQLSPELSEKDQRIMLRDRHDSQEWRIAYVAVTRAKHRLCVTGAHWVGSPEPRKSPVRPSPLYELIRSHERTEVVLESPAPPDRPASLGFRADRIASPDPLFGEGGWQDGLARAVERPHALRREATERGLVQAYDAAVEDFQQMLFRLPQTELDEQPVVTSTSVSGLVTYAGCPKRFEWSEVDRLPRRYSRAARRGVDVHRRIELHHRGVLPLDEVASDLYDVPERTDAEPERVDPYTVYLGSRFAETRPFLVEAPFELNAGDLVVRGRVDAIYRDDEGWEVVDFKSGRPSADPAVRVQLQAYALAVQAGAFSSHVPARLDVTFAYLGGELVERTEVADSSWLERAQSDIQSLADGITGEVFDPRPSISCGRCDFVDFCAAGTEFLRR